MEIGRFDTYIDITTHTTTTDSTTGEVRDVVNAVLTVPATINEFRGREKLNSQREVSTRIATFTIRYQSGIGADAIISYDSLTWDIQSISPIGKRRREALDIIAEARS